MVVSDLTKYQLSLLIAISKNLPMYTVHSGPEDSTVGMMYLWDHDLIYQPDPIETTTFIITKSGKDVIAQYFMEEL